MKQAKLQSFFSRAPAAQAPSQIEEHANQHKAEPERQHIIWGLIVGSEARPWNRRLIQKLDADSLLALLGTSTAGRDQVLSQRRKVHMSGKGNSERFCWLYHLLDRAGATLECLTVDDLPPTPSIKDAKPRWKKLRITQNLRLSVLDSTPVAPGLEIQLGECINVLDDPICDSSSITLTCDTTTNLNLERLAGVRLLSCEAACIGPGVLMKTEHQQAAALSQGFKFLRLLPISPPDDAAGREGNTLGLIDWTMSLKVVNELRNMPRWALFSLGSVKWLPGSKRYRYLLASLPDSITGMYVGRGGSNCVESLGPDMLSDEQLVRMVLGLPRQRRNHLEIQLSHREDRYEVMDEIEEEMQYRAAGGCDKVMVLCTYTN